MAFLVIASLGGISYLLWEVSQRRHELEQIKTQLKQATQRLASTIPASASMPWMANQVCFQPDLLAE